MHIIQIAMTWLVFNTIPSIKGYGYSKKEQHLWPKKEKLCAGKLQSPVAISTSKAVPLSLPALEMIGYHDFLPTPQILENTGHTGNCSLSLFIVKLIVNKTAKRLPYIFGAVLKENQRYEIEQLHFHWGTKNNRGAEHVLNGIRYPMEVHIVHRNMAYSNFSDALWHEDGVVVVAAFFQVIQQFLSLKSRCQILQDENNEFLQSFVKKLADVQWAYTEVSININVTLTSLIPSNTDIFYTYKGSLTTPPCSEAVTWIIFANPVPISFRQVRQL
ncbi:carbonic anhydrase 9-like [Pseudomyrmex gracilis]|uniref:carbonic anhydrase 9-like n=1 Tax=Pseudomyrmex gracilis TaxID=219809 RepID=UPI0009956793|nr:carbonic anhydrase 9-like [Pseudomyrmex gracilis]